MNSAWMHLQPWTGRGCPWTASAHLLRGAAAAGWHLETLSSARELGGSEENTRVVDNLEKISSDSLVPGEPPMTTRFWPSNIGDLL